LIVKFAQWLDRTEFLNIRLWEFSLRNTTRFFLWYFLLRVLLLHPLKALRGFQNYRKLVKNSDSQQLNGSSDLSEIRKYLLSKSSNPRRFLIAPGFCMKPYDEVAAKPICPVGHFNHNCIVFDRPEMLKRKQINWPNPCNECSIGTLAQVGAELGANFYIMTSALDIAKDLFLPAIRGKGTNLGIFLLCPYSTEAFTLGLMASGIKGALLTFCKGACLDHEDFTKADKGVKSKQTFIEKSMFQNLLKKFRSLSMESVQHHTEPFTYTKKNNVFTISK